MNRRDFELLSRTIRQMGTGVNTGCRFSGTDIARRLADEIAAADGCSGFNKGAFLKACGVNNEPS